MKQLEWWSLNQRLYTHIYLRGQISTKLVRSIVTRGLSVCDGAHVSDDGTKGPEHGMMKRKSSGWRERETGRVRALGVTTRLVLFEAI